MSAERAFALPNGDRRRRRSVTLRALPGVHRTPRAPFIVLVLMVLGVGLVGLLILNTALQQGSSALATLESETTALRDRAELLASQVALLESPAELSEQARDLGMVPAEDLEFVDLGPAPPADGGAE